jgi:hypothetical protein
MMKRTVVDRVNQLIVYGNHKNLPALLNRLEILMKGLQEHQMVSEGELRVMIQDIMEVTDCPLDITLKGNGVYPFTKTIRDFKRVVKANDTYKMTKHLYHFFSLCCGTIAHYNLNGWASVYPNNMALRDLFNRNEYGYRLVEYIPEWKTDTKRIVVEMDKILKGAVR